MSQLLLFVLLGMGTGALVGGLSLGLVLNYQGAGVPNFAIGAVAMLGAFEFYTLKTAGQLFVPLPGVPLDRRRDAVGRSRPAFVVALLMCAVVGVLFDVLVLGRLRTSSPLAKLVASLGLLLTLQAHRHPAVRRRRPIGAGGAPGEPLGRRPRLRHGRPLRPLHLHRASSSSPRSSSSRLYRFTRFGLATRAAAENEATAVLTGLAPRRISTANTMLAFVLAGALGILIAPTSQLDPTTIPLAVIPAMGAALAGPLHLVPDRGGCRVRDGGHPVRADLPADEGLVPDRRWRVAARRRRPRVLPDHHGGPAPARAEPADPGRR